MAVSKRLRFEVMRRDNHTCRYCGATAPDVPLTVDHVVPTTLGGGDDPANLVTACAPCNSGKSATPPGADLVSDVSQDAIRWAAAVKRAAELEMINREQVMAVTHATLDILSYAASYLPVNANDSIEQFLAQGLHPDEISDSAYTTMAATHVSVRATWRYFCGVCWRKLERRQEAARALVDQDGNTDPGPQPTPADVYGAGVYAHLALVCDGPTAGTD